MITKIYKIPDKVIYRAIFLILIAMNLKYFFLPIQVPFTMLTQDFIWKNKFYSSVYDTRNVINKIPDFFDDAKTGYASDVQKSNVFDYPESIRAFYTAQYAVVPSILRNDNNQKYSIGSFEKEVKLPAGFSIDKKINKNLYVLKRY